MLYIAGPASLLGKKVVELDLGVGVQDLGVL